MSKKENFITVTDFNILVKDTLNAKFPLQFKIKGEISNIKLSGNHTYLTLKDDDSSINITAWNTKFPNIKNGDDVIVTGKISFYLKGGSYQINATKIERIGIGHLHEILEENKKIFETKGYFSKSQKLTPIPKSIKRIGILTASTGAALHDILYVLNQNMFSGEVYIKNCSVQGQNCPSSVSDGISYFEKLHKSKSFDILIITRGGGSFEDLIGYSSKEIVKAINKTNIYTISAVGHEVDTMLSDYAANYRAPTPSVAGEIVSNIEKKKKEQLFNNIEYMSLLKNQIKNKLLNFDETIKNYSKMLKQLDPQSYLTNELLKYSRLKEQFHSQILNKIDKYKNEINLYELKNEALNPKKTFTNGYVAIVDSHNNLINTLENFNKSIKLKQKLKIIFVDGEVELPLKSK